MTQINSDLITTLKRAVCFLLFRNPTIDTQAPAPGLSAVAILIAMTLLSLIGFEAYLGETELSFNAYGISAWLAGWALMIVGLVALGTRDDISSLAQIVSDLCATTIVFSCLALALVVISPLLPQTNAFLDFTAQEVFETVTIMGAIIWGIAVTVFIGRVHWKGAQWFPGLKMLFVAFLPTLFVPHQPVVYGAETDWSRYDVWELWKNFNYVKKVSDETASSENEQPPFDYEAAIYRQRDLVARVLSGIKPSRDSDKPNIYFVAAAPYASQDVFKREVLATKELFDSRFGSAQRSAVLINHRDTAVTLPMANATNLKAMLTGIAQSMNVRRDVLVLFLTTHGTKGALSVSFPGFTFNDLTPGMLANILDQTQIRNRVLIISACHSGSFLPRLKNEDTIILTAAHADKTSFGCSNERDWTYFGDALFNRALRKTFSLQAAFEQASKLIKVWETESKLDPSEPQIFVGERIRHKWNRIAKALYAEHKSSFPRLLSRQAALDLLNTSKFMPQPGRSRPPFEQTAQTTF